MVWTLNAVWGGVAGKAPALAALVLGALVAHAAAEWTWRLMPAPQPVPGPTAATVEGGETTAVAPSVKPAGVSGFHLFGVPDGGEAAAVRDEPLPETRAALALKGIYAAARPQASRAIIADGDGAAGVYGPGDTLPGNVRLVEIQRERVVVSRGGTLEALLLPREHLGGSMDSDAPEPGATVTLPRGSVQARLDDPSTWGRDVEIEPVTADDGTEGFRITRLRQTDELRTLGLRAGDIVTRANDISLSMRTSPLRLVQELNDADSVELAVIRDDEQFTMTYELRE